MITSEFIIQYTNALYSTPTELAPRYDEFRDMFSSGQIYSKEWIINEIVKIDAIRKCKHICIVGAWFGTLGMMLKYRFPGLNITMIDIDPRCKEFIDNVTYGNTSMHAVTYDMYGYDYGTFDFIINTSCEHITNTKEWLDTIPKGKIVILQSNNFDTVEDHINCVSDEDEFVKQTELTKILYKGKLEMPMYTRFMVIGQT
jgi:hypothetical protein